MTLGVGMLGCGFVGFRHASALQAITRQTDVPVRLVAVCDLDPQRAGVFGETFDARIEPDHQALLEAEDIQAVYLCTPTATHLPLVKAAASAGKALFCEKPLGRDLSEAEAVAGAVTSAGVANQVGLVLRSSILYLALRSLLDDLGEVMAVVFRDDQAWPLEDTYGSTWRADPEVAGSGVLLEHSIHDVDLVRWLFGDPEPRGALVRHHAAVKGIEDSVTALLEVPDGPSITLTTLWHEMTARRSERRLEVIGTRGRVVVEGDFSGTVEHQRAGGQPVTLEQSAVLELVARRERFDEDETVLARQVPLEDLWFARALLEGRPPTPSIEEGLAAHRTVEGIYRVAASGA